jgi:amino acid permease
MIKFVPMLSVGLAVFLGCLFSMMLGGFGPCAASLSAKSIGGALVAAFIVSWLGAVFLQTRWLAALLFSSPLFLALPFAAQSQQWGRCIALFACMVVPFAVVALFGFDRRKTHRA